MLRAVLPFAGLFYTRSTCVRGMRRKRAPNLRFSMGLSCASPVTPKAPTLLRHPSNFSSGYFSANLSCKKQKSKVKILFLPFNILKVPIDRNGLLNTMCISYQVKHTLQTSETFSRKLLPSVKNVHKREKHSAEALSLYIYTVLLIDSTSRTELKKQCTTYNITITDSQVDDFPPESKPVWNTPRLMQFDI